MSGRKASEVNALLRNGKETRSAAIKNLEKFCKEAEESVKRAEEKVESVKKKIDGVDLTIPSEVQEEFSEAAKEIENEIADFKNRVMNMKISYSDEDFRKIEKQYDEVDIEAEKVREALKKKIGSQGRNDPWYCDAEYAGAANVQRKYKDLANEVQKLSRKSAGITTKAAVLISNCENDHEQADKFRLTIDGLEKKAHEIQNLRKRASDAREVMKSDFANIDEKTVSKFNLTEKYKELKSKIDGILKLSDAELVEKCTQIIDAISRFNNELDLLVEEYNKRKQELENKIKVLKDRVNRDSFSKPETEFMDKLEMMSLIEFLNQYGNDDEDYANDIISMIKKAESLMKKESFDATESELESLEKLIADASGYASQIHENKMKTIVNMLTIQQVMLDMNYDVNVIENPGKEDGYCIECTAGDEYIKFDKVTVVDDGRPVIDIDHKESTTGTCAGTWEDIRKNLSEEGLFIEDIKKNGRSIHAANTGVSNKGVNNLSGKVLKN